MDTIFDKQNPLEAKLKDRKGLNELEFNQEDREWAQKVLDDVPLIKEFKFLLRWQNDGRLESSRQGKKKKGKKNKY